MCGAGMEQEFGAAPLPLRISQLLERNVVCHANQHSGLTASMKTSDATWWLSDDRNSSHIGIVSHAL